MTALYCRNPATLWRRAGGVVVLLVPRTREVLTMSGAGRALWDALASPQSMDEMTTRLATLFGAAPAAVRTDLATILSELAARNLIVQASGETS